MQHSTTSQADRDFRAAFECCMVSPPQFSHEAHLRLAYVYLVENDLDAAQQKMRSALRAFLAGHGLPAEKFHETLTSAWVLAVRHFMGRAPSLCFAEFIARSQALLDSKVMLTHYSSSLLFSPAARATYMAPDLEAIPH